MKSEGPGFQLSKSGDKSIWLEDECKNTPYYQLIREKERIIQEYQFKYETTKMMYESMLQNLRENNQTGINASRVARIIEDVINIFCNEMRKFMIPSQDIVGVSANAQRQCQKLIESLDLQSNRYCDSYSRKDAIIIDHMIGKDSENLSSTNHSINSSGNQFSTIDLKEQSQIRRSRSPLGHFASDSRSPKGGRVPKDLSGELSQNQAKKALYKQLYSGYNCS